MTPEHERPGWGVHRGQTGFGDAHALLITSLSSLAGLNERIVEHGGEAVPMNRFRPNIVVAGWPVAIVRRGDHSRLWTRNRHDVSARFPGIVAAAARQIPDGVVLDGVI